ncbi:hypothetical protein TUSST3_14300 [Streptomyces sp. TUS-ST3]|nr:hypothetical protein TUSST3_14300 [Streptomyces sp. TUS-ST3]
MRRGLDRAFGAVIRVWSGARFRASSGWLRRGVCETLDSRVTPAAVSKTLAGDQHGQQQAEGVAAEVTLAPGSGPGAAGLRNGTTSTETGPNAQQAPRGRPGRL